VTALSRSATETQSTDEPTDSPTNEPATAAVPSIVPVGNTTLPVILRYDDQVLTLLNQGKININVSNLTFVQISSGNNPPRFTSQEWSSISSRSISALQPGDCLQVIRNDRFLSASTTKPDYCDFVQAWRQISTLRLFWVSTVSDAIFEIRRGSAILVTCPISAGECAFDPK
jgi:hypothetical protein